MAKKRQRKPRAVKPVNLSFPVFTYNPQGLQSRSEKELRREYSRLRSIARKRLERMGASEFASSDIYRYNKARFKQLADVRSMTELRHLLVDVSRFLLSDRSTITGLKESRAKSIEYFHEQGYTFITEENYSDWRAFLKYVRDMEGYVYDYSSELTAFEKASAAGNTNNVQRVYEFYVQQTARGNDIPSP